MPFSDGMATPLINSFSYHCRTTYGFPVGKIPLDLGEPCPNRNRGGCLYCAAPAYTPAYLDRCENVFTQIERGKKSLLKDRFSKYFAYFQQETPTASAASTLLPFFDRILADPDCVGLILSTRPDFLGDELLSSLADLLKAHGKDCLVEIGVQSVHEASLVLLNRRHDFLEVVEACSRLRRYGCFQVGAHLIFGIPGESEEDMLVSVDTLVRLGVDALKFHHLQVIKGTPLETMYRRGEVCLFSLQEYCDFLLRLLPRIPLNIVIHRLWATAHPSLLVAPKWNVLATELSRDLRRQMTEKGVCQGDAVDPWMVEGM